MRFLKIFVIPRGIRLTKSSRGILLPPFQIKVGRTKEQQPPTELSNAVYITIKKCMVSLPYYSIFIREKHTNALKLCRLYECLFQWTRDRPRKWAITALRLVASDTPNSDNLNGDNCGHSSDILSQNGVCLCVCVRACLRACVRSCVRA